MRNAILAIALIASPALATAQTKPVSSMVPASGARATSEGGRIAAGGPAGSAAMPADSIATNNPDVSKGMAVTGNSFAAKSRNKSLVDRIGGTPGF